MHACTAAADQVLQGLAVRMPECMYEIACPHWTQHTVRYTPASPATNELQKTLYAQGVGKTTACGKLAAFLKKRRKSVLMVATDVYRPAAIDQLVKLGSKVDVPVFELGTAVSPVEIARQGVAKAKAEGIDVVIVDTAGRLQVRGCVGEGSWRVCGAVRDVDSLRGGGVMIEVAEVV